MQTNQDISTRRGDTCRVNFTLVGADGTALLLADLGGADVVWRYSNYPEGPAIAEIDATIVDAGAGKAAAQVTVPTDDAGIFFHECEMTLAGDVSTLATGKLTIDPDMAPPTP